MKADTLKRITNQISVWRKQMDNSATPLEINGEFLNETLKLLNGSGLDEGLAVFIILSCEWAFRIRKVSETEVQNLLLEIEKGFETLNLTRRAIFHIVKALENSIRKTVAEEKRFPIAFPPPPISDFERLASEVDEINAFEKQEAEKKRLKPTKLVPVRPGPPPWISPWVAGSMINLYFSKKGVQKYDEILNLMMILLNRDTVEDGDFRKIETSLINGNLEKFLDNCVQEFDWFMSSEEAIAEREKRPKKSWEDMLLVDWDEKNGRSVFDGKGSIGPPFRCQLESVQELIKNYSTSGKRKSQTERKK